MTAGNVHPPLYYLILWVWIKASGTSEPALRFLSGMFSVGTVFAVYHFALWFAHETRHPNARHAAMLCALWIALSPGQLSIAHTARMYPLLGLLSICACLALSNAVQNPTIWRPWVCYLVVAVAALYTHNYAVFLLAGNLLWLAFESLRTHSAKLLLRGAIAFVLIGLAYLPWVPFLLWQVRQVSGDYWIQPVTGTVVSVAPVQFVSPGLNKLPDLPWYVAWLLGLLTFLCIYPWRHAACERLLLFVALAHGGGLAVAQWFVGRPILVPRYLLPVLPLFLVPFACFVTRVPDPFIKKAIVFGVTSIMLLFVYREATDFEVFFHRESCYEQALDFISKQGIQTIP